MHIIIWKILTFIKRSILANKSFKREENASRLFISLIFLILSQFNSIFKMKIKCFKFLLFFLLALFGFAESYESLSKVVNQFAVDLYTKVAKTTDGNVIISPLCVQTTLTMALLGASGNTEKEMKEALHFGKMSKNDIVENFKSLTKEYNENLALRIANKIFIKESLSVKESYKNLLTNNFDAELGRVNFRNREKTAKEISDWVAKRTHYKIKDFVQKESFERSASLMIVNAIYFSGSWQHAFDPELTHKNEFHLNEKDKAEVDYMVLTGKKFRYNYYDDFEILELSYKKSSNMSMLILLPRTKSGLSDLEKKLTTLNFENVIKSMKMQDVDVIFPKFKIDLDVDLNEPLGMSRIFEEGDFSDILESGETLRLSNVFHKAFIEVDEIGTTTSAAAGATLSFLSLPTQFRADRPFLFILKSNNDHIFMGRFVKP